MQDGFVGGFNPYAHNVNGAPTSPGMPQMPQADMKLRMPSASSRLRRKSNNGSVNIRLSGSMAAPRVTSPAWL